MGKPGRCTFRGACHLLMRSSQSHGTETGQSRDLSLNYQKKQVISKTCSGYSRGCTKGQEKGQEFQRSPYFTRGRQLRNKKWPFSPRCALIDTTETYKVIPTTERVTYAGVGPERRVEWCGRDGFSGWHPDTSLRPSVSNMSEEGARVSTPEELLSLYGQGEHKIHRAHCECQSSPWERGMRKSFSNLFWRCSVITLKQQANPTGGEVRSQHHFWVSTPQI